MNGGTINSLINAVTQILSHLQFLSPWNQTFEVKVQVKTFRLEPNLSSKQITLKSEFSVPPSSFIVYRFSNIP